MIGDAMFSWGKYTASIMVLFAVALHYSWVILIAIDAEAVNATAVNALYRFFYPPSMLMFILMLAATMAVMGLFTNRLVVACLLVPQQILLMMSAAGAIEAIWLSQYADGVIRARAFIAADQIYSVLAAIGHTIAISVHVTRLSRY